MFSEQNVIETVPHDPNITITQGRLSKHKGHLRACQSVNWSIAKVLCCRSNQVGFKNAHEWEQKVKKERSKAEKHAKRHTSCCLRLLYFHLHLVERKWLSPIWSMHKMRQDRVILLGPWRILSAVPHLKHCNPLFWMLTLLVCTACHSWERERQTDTTNTERKRFYARSRVQQSSGCHLNRQRPPDVDINWTYLYTKQKNAHFSTCFCIRT